MTVLYIYNIIYCIYVKKYYTSSIPALAKNILDKILFLATYSVDIVTFIDPFHLSISSEVTILYTSSVWLLNVISNNNFNSKLLYYIIVHSILRGS